MEVDLFNIRIWRINVAWEQRLHGNRHRYYREGIKTSRLYFYIGHLFIGVNMYYRKTWPFFSFGWYGRKYMNRYWEGVSTGTIRTKKATINMVGAYDPIRILADMAKSGGGVLKVCPDPFDDLCLGYEFPDGRYFIYDEGEGVVWIHCRWEGDPYCSATHEFLDDGIVPLGKPGAEMQPGERYTVACHKVRVVKQGYNLSDTVLFCRDETTRDWWRYYWFRGIYHVEDVILWIGGKLNFHTS